MREVIETLRSKIEFNKFRKYSEWLDGYISGLSDAIEIVQSGIDSLIVTGKNYFVIMYHNGDKFLPYVEEMRLYKISKKNRVSYCFSRNLDATIFNTASPDLVLSSVKGLRERVFFTREKAEEAITI